MDLVTLLAAMFGAPPPVSCPAMAFGPSSVIASPGSPGSTMVVAGCGHGVTVACPSGLTVIGPGATWRAGDVVLVALAPGFESAGLHGVCHVRSVDGLAQLAFTVGA